MNWKRIQGKTLGEIKMPDGVFAQCDSVNDNIKSIWFATGDGTLVRVSVPSAEYHSLIVEIPAPPEKIDKWQVRGVYKEIEVCRLFDNEWNAKSWRDEFVSGCRDEVELTIEKVAVEVP